MGNWKDPPKKPVLSAYNSMMCGHSRTINIPPPGCRLSLLHSPPEQVVKSVKPDPSSTSPLSCPKEMRVKVQEDPPKGMSKNEENNGQDNQNTLLSSGDLPLTSRPLRTKVLTLCTPRPLDLSPKFPQDNLSGNTQMSPMGSSSKGRGFTSSYWPAGGSCPPPKACVRSSSAL